MQILITADVDYNESTDPANLSENITAAVTAAITAVAGVTGVTISSVATAE